MVSERNPVHSYIWLQVLLFIFAMSFMECSHAEAESQPWADHWSVKMPIVPAVKRVMNHPNDPKAIAALVEGKWRVIATLYLDKGPLVAKDAYKEVLGKEGRIVLSGKAPEIVSFGWENPNCGPATPYGEIESWCQYCVTTPGYLQMGWTYVRGMDMSHVHTWNGKPLSAAQARALTPLYAADETTDMDQKKFRNWLLLGFKRQCNGNKKPESVLLLEPTRGGMLVQYYADGWIIYERVGSEKASADCSQAHTASEKTICADPKLKELDRTLAQAYHQGFVRTQAQSPARQALIQSQRAWLKTPNTCNGDTACLQQAYQRRIDVLNAQSR